MLLLVTFHAPATGFGISSMGTCRLRSGTPGWKSLGLSLTCTSWAWSHWQPSSGSCPSGNCQRRAGPSHTRKHVRMHCCRHWCASATSLKSVGVGPQRFLPMRPHCLPKAGGNFGVCRPQSDRVAPCVAQAFGCGIAGKAWGGATPRSSSGGKWLPTPAARLEIPNRGGASGAF